MRIPNSPAPDDHLPLARLFAALGNELRLRILDLVSSRKEMCLCELVEELGMSQANLWRHVAVLREAGLLRERKLGAMVIVRVEEAALEQAGATLLARLRANHRRSARHNVDKRLAARCA